MPANVAFTAAVSVTVSGIEFAAVDQSPTSVLADAVCATSSWTTSTSVLCLSTAGALPPNVATVTIIGTVGTGSSVFSFDGSPHFGAHAFGFALAFRLPCKDCEFPAVSAPVASSTTPAVIADGISITVGGLNFAVADLTASAVLGTVICATTSWLATTSVSCRTGSGLVATLYSPVTVNRVVGTGASLFSFDGAPSAVAPMVCWWR